MNEVNESIAVEWSHSQNSYHRTPLSRALAANQRSLRSNRQSLYSIVAIVPTQEDAEKLIAGMKKQTANRAVPE